MFFNRDFFSLCQNSFLNEIGVGYILFANAILFGVIAMSSMCLSAFHWVLTPNIFMHNKFSSANTMFYWYHNIVFLIRVNHKNYDTSHELQIKTINFYSKQAKYL